MYVYVIYITLLWEFKGATQCLTHILPGQWEGGLPMTLIPCQFKEMMRFNASFVLWDSFFVEVAKLSIFAQIDYLVVTKG